MPHNSLRSHARGGFLIGSALVAVATLALTRISPAATSPVLSIPNIAVTTPVAHPPVLLADEITRRLRRMGINFTRTRLPHPYDDVGEIC